jgi:hypothetical protein
MATSSKAATQQVVASRKSKLAPLPTKSQAAGKSSARANRFSSSSSTSGTSSSSDSDSSG